MSIIFEFATERAITNDNCTVII